MLVVIDGIETNDFKGSAIDALFTCARESLKISLRLVNKDTGETEYRQAYVSEHADHIEIESIARTAVKAE